MTRYKTPNALRHDSHTLAADVRSLLEATANVADETVAEARGRLTEALEDSKQLYNRLQEKTIDSAHAADHTIRENPYQSIGVAFGIGALLGFLLSRK